MSHQVRQVSQVQLRDLTLLGRAVGSIQVPSLGTHLVLDQNKKEARYYGSYRDACDAVITYARPLTAEEQTRHYEIAVKREEAVINGQKVPVFNLYADTHASDRQMEEKIATIFENYIITGDIAREAQNMGAVETREIHEGVPAGYRRVRIYLPNA